MLLSLVQEVIVPLPAKLLTGAIAGVIGTSIIFPLDMVKTRLQVSFLQGVCFNMIFSRFVISSMFSMSHKPCFVYYQSQNQSKAAAGTPIRYSGPVDCFRKIIAQEGVQGLYQGIKPNLIGVAPEKSIKLSLNETFREYFTKSNGDGKIRLHQEILSGGGAGFFQVAATNPMEITKLRMQLAGESGKKLTATNVISELGLRGLYRGTAACWLRDVPFSFIFFPLNAHLKRMFGGDNSVLGMFAAGAIAGATAAGTVTPCDVVKTRLQVVGGLEKYKNIGGAFSKIYAEEGLCE
jgi:solute carrier family 25 (mitochondrial aspartate/glutamate transporter), member 12/13